MLHSKHGEQELKAFFLQSVKANFKRGETTFPPYAAAQSIYFIESGFVKVVAPRKDGQQSLLCILGPGNIFPFPGGFGDYEIESFYIAMSEVKTRRVSAELMLHVVENNRILSLAIMWQIQELLTAYSNRVYTLALRSQSARLASFLILLNMRFGITQNKEILLNIPLSHAEIASAISSTRETVTRLLSELTAKSVIEQRNHLIVIKDIPYLLDILQ